MNGTGSLNGFALSNRFGGFFDVEFGAPNSEDSPWRPISELLGEPDHARRKVVRARELMVQRLGIAPPTDRVLASITFLGIAARLIAPWFGAVLLSGQAAPVVLERLWWQPFDGGAMPLLVSPGTATSTGSAELNTGSAALDLAGAAELDLAGAAESVLAGPVALLVTPLLALYRDAFALSERVLWGNVASGVAGAARAIA
ncbi:MAG: hypothetical protein JWO63_1872, partial [Frankiales bacterium]|nr:hypothetical protein [Frankiales bacterium]